MEFDLSKRHCHYFNETTKIPHGSFNEKAISNWLVDFAKEHGLKYVQDEDFNVIIYKGASEGYENAEPLILQAHMDMVCEKNKDSDHDFEKDPLDLYVEDGWLKARGTTLGADDCAGVAYMLAVLEDDELPHPPLECIFTTMEEVGLIGSMKLKAEDIHGKRMVSLDGGGEVTTLLSSCGGCQVDLKHGAVYEKTTAPAYALGVRGLLGGHSGGEISKEKGNANVLAARVVKEMIFAGADIKVVSFNGGLKGNAIPREADIVFVSDTDEAKLQEMVKASEKAIMEELEFSDAGFRLEFVKAEADRCLVQEASDEVIDYAYLMPNGFMHKSMAIEGLTLTSLNLGIVRTYEDHVEYTVTIRSALGSGVSNLVNILKTLASRLNWEVNTSAAYPGWNYSPVSAMRDIYRNALKDLYGKDLVEIAAHGGCECGVFSDLVPGIDIVSCGPVTMDIHTPEERLDLASFDRTYEILRYIVKACH